MSKMSNSSGRIIPPSFRHAPTRNGTGRKHRFVGIGQASQSRKAVVVPINDVMCGFITKYGAVTSARFVAWPTIRIIPVTRTRPRTRHTSGTQDPDRRFPTRRSGDDGVLRPLLQRCFGFRSSQASGVARRSSPLRMMKLQRGRDSGVLSSRISAEGGIRGIPAGVQEKLPMACKLRTVPMCPLNNSSGARCRSVEPRVEHPGLNRDRGIAHIPLRQSSRLLATG